MSTSRAAVVFAALCVVASPAWSDGSAAANYATHCASCHGGERLGGAGPALLPENLERLRKPAAAETIGKGRMATQMPAFADKLSASEIEALVASAYAPPAVPPVWGEREIVASRIEHVSPGALGAKPVFGADPRNLFVVVESGCDALHPSR